MSTLSPDVFKRVRARIQDKASSHLTKSLVDAKGPIAGIAKATADSIVKALTGENCEVKHRFAGCQWKIARHQLAVHFEWTVLGSEGTMTAKSSSGLTLIDVANEIAAADEWPLPAWLKQLTVHSLKLTLHGGKVRAAMIEFEFGNALMSGIRGRLDVTKPFTDEAGIAFSSEGNFCSTPVGTTHHNKTGPCTKISVKYRSKTLVLLLKNVQLSAVLGPLAAVSSKITSIMQIAELTVTFDSKGALSCSYKCRLKLFLQARPAIELLFGLLR